MREVLQEALRLNNDGRKCAIATIVGSAGSSPQKEGAKMIVRDDGTVLGTLGGGCLEAETVQAAIMAMKDESPKTAEFRLTEQHGGLVCGGTVSVFIEPFIPAPSLIILGAGHVGKALSKIAAFSGFRVTVVDNREEYASRERLPDAESVKLHDFKDVFSHVVADDACFIVVATRGHNHDFEAIRASMKTRARYIGLLGSRRKKALLMKCLREEGFTEEDLSRISTPVGLAIGAVTPEEIAVSIVAEMIEIRRKSDKKQGGCDTARCGQLEEDGKAKTASPHSR